MDVGQYLEIFLDETKEHLQSLNTQFLELEQEPDNMDTINEIFRAAHSLKGMSGTMGYKRMQNLTHHMENIFSEVRSGTIKVQNNMVDVLFQCLDALEEYLTNIQENSDEGENENLPLIQLLSDNLEEQKSGGTAQEDDAQTEKETTATKPSGEGEGWASINLSESHKNVLTEAMSQGMNVLGITVTIQEDCILKAARAFLVFKAIEDVGEVIISDPTTQDIEDEKFDFEFSIIAISGESFEKIKELTSEVSEIESVVGRVLTKEEIGIPETKAINKDELEKVETAPVPQNEPKTEQPESAGAKQPQQKAVEKKAGNKPNVNRTVRVDIEKLDVLMNLVSELIIAKNSLVATNTADSANKSVFNEQVEYLESITTNLHESVMKVRMVPIESVVSKFPRMIRDLSKKLNKSMELHMSGEETELDRTVVDEIGDPLMHLLRNSADHGLESGDERVKKGKPRAGTIYLKAYQDGNNVIIEVGDDGNGIDVEKVKQSAIKRGTITEEQSIGMSDKEIIDLLFLPSFSTAKVVSDVSGRGVGLDVVKSKIESLSGEVEVQSVLGEGSKWTIRLPLTLAIIQALMVVVGEEKYALSLSAIQTIEDVSINDIYTVQNKEVMNLRGVVIPIIRLNDVLECGSKKNDENIVVAIVKKGDKLAGLVVDELIGQLEIVIKPLGKYIAKSKIISGATILGDGEIALIIDANSLL